MCDGCEWEEALDLCDEIKEMLEELPEAALDFAESVEEKVTSIAEWIEENEHVTSKQERALENMRSGCERWIS